MSIVKIIDDYVLEFGNQRFLEGWNGATEHIIKLLEETKQKTATSMDADSNYYAGLVQAIALIKGEN